MTDIRLDHAGIAEVLRSAEVAAVVEAAAQAVVANAQWNATVSGEPIPVTTRSRTASGARLSPRAAVDVTMEHPAALRVEAKRGTLLRAAAAAGLEARAAPR